MDGKLFLYSSLTPPRISYPAAFVFDLQRFATTTVSSASELQTKIDSATAGDTIKLDSSFSDTLETTLNITKNLTLDLNGQTLTTSAAVGIQVNNNVEFTLNDGSAEKSGTIKSTYATYNRDDNSGVVRVGQPSTNDSTATNATFNMNGGTIEAGKVIGINIIGVSTTNVVEGCSVTSDESCAVYFGARNIANQGDASYLDQTKGVIGQPGTNGGGTLNMTGGTLESKGEQAAIGTNGNHTGGTKINISGGTVKYDSTATSGNRMAIYASAVEELSISGDAKIESSHVGIEIRTGTLKVSGNAQIKASNNGALEYKYSSDGASCSDGVAIVVSQHSTQKSINVNIDGGTIEGSTALAVINANSNPAFGNDVTGMSSTTINGKEIRYDNGTLLGEWDETNQKRVVGTITVDVENATIKSTGSAAFNFTGNSTNGYTLSGGNTIANLDNRSKVSLTNNTIEGRLISTTRTVSDETKEVEAYDLVSGNKFTIFEDDITQYELFTADTATTGGMTVQAKSAKGWNLTGKNSFQYFLKNGDSGKKIAEIAPAITGTGTDAVISATDLKLTTTSEDTATVDVDLTKTLFNNTDNVATTFVKLDASNATNANIAFNITGNDNITEIKGGAGNDSIKPGDVPSVTLEGGEGDDLFFFDGNKNTITDFGKGNDSVTLANSKFRPANADFLATTDKITIDFGGGDALMFEGLGTNEVSLPGGHIFATRYHAFDKQITFTSVKDDAFDATSEAKFANYATIDAASASAISIMGNSQDNRIIGSNKGGSLNGGAGNDRLIVTDRNSDAKYLFEHKAAGKDSIEGFDDTRDTLDVDATTITEAKGSGSKLTLTFGKDNSVVLKSDVDIEKVSLNANGDYLTNSGYRANDTFKLFANAKGKIDLTDTPYKGTGIKTIDATKATKQSVTLTADSVVSSLALAANNKKDLFVYGGGAVSISGYEAGTDKLNIADVGAVSLFTVDGDNGVSINAGGTNTISLQGALADQEVLIRDGGKSNSYQKFVFHADGVLYNKGKKPTEANIYSNVNKEAVVQVADSVKKIFLQTGVSGASIASGNNKATLDASEANGVSLIGGAKNNKFIASAGDDLFVYKGGKDNIQDFDAKDKITLDDDGGFDLNNAKISASGKSLKFKFTNKNVLTLKSDGKITSASINGGNYTFSKNAVGLNDVVSLTNAFSGTYNLAKSTAIGNTVNGSAVKKNLTFKGTDGAESLSGGQKKTTFKGGGGDDIFYGGTGKDVFFYAKTDSGDKTIQNFDFGSNNDKIKIASGTIKTISKSSDAITFSTNGGSLTVTKDADNVLIKANNTYYWFAESADSEHSVSVGDLITADTKVSNAQAVATGYGVIDLGYSTNLVKTNLATKAGSFTFSQGKITNNNTTT